MKVVVDLTDEQADEWTRYYSCHKTPTSSLQGTPMFIAGCRLRDAIVATRPKPLKVGDKVKYCGWEYGVIAIIHSVYSQRQFLIAERDDSPNALFLTSNDRFVMADGGPIVWPEP